MTSKQPYPESTPRITIWINNSQNDPFHRKSVRRVAFFRVWTPMTSNSARARDLEFTTLLIKKLKSIAFSPSQSLTLEVEHRWCKNMGISKLSSLGQCCGSGSGAFLTPGSGIRNRFFPNLGSLPHIFENLLTIFWVKSSIILWKLAQIFVFSTSKLK